MISGVQQALEDKERLWNELQNSKATSRVQFDLSASLQCADLCNKFEQVGKPRGIFVTLLAPGQCQTVIGSGNISNAMLLSMSSSSHCGKKRFIRFMPRMRKV